MSVDSLWVGWLKQQKVRRNDHHPLLLEEAIATRRKLSSKSKNVNNFIVASFASLSGNDEPAQRLRDWEVGIKINGVMIYTGALTFFGESIKTGQVDLEGCLLEEN